MHSEFASLLFATFLVGTNVGVFFLFQFRIVYVQMDMDLISFSSNVILAKILKRTAFRSSS